MAKLLTMIHVYIGKILHSIFCPTCLIIAGLISTHISFAENIHKFIMSKIFSGNDLNISDDHWT